MKKELADSSASRLAQKLLKEYCHLMTFDVDPMDAKIIDPLVAALKQHGCKVKRRQFSTLITVTCPPIKT
jgi:hypothetical protein